VLVDAADPVVGHERDGRRALSRKDQDAHPVVEDDLADRKPLAGRFLRSAGYRRREQGRAGERAGE
jgi:hypothetical protein